MVVSANSKTIFLEKRKRLIQQIYLENEYKKRNFILNNDVYKYKNVINYLLDNIVYNSDDLFRVELEDRIIAIKMDEDNLKLFCNQGSIEEKVLKVEIFSRKNYSIPFYNLMMPGDIRVVLEKLDTDYLPNPIIPSFYDKNKTIDTVFFSTVLSYNHTHKIDDYLLNIEKEYIRLELESIMKNESLDYNIALLASLFKCSNGHELTPTGFDVLSEKLDSYLIDDIRNNSFVTRLNGILYFDFVLSLAAVSKNYKVDYFITFFSDILGEEPRKNYPENVKRKYRDALRTASLCIQESKILPVSNVGKMPKIPKVTLPEHVPFFGEYGESIL